MEIRQVPKVFQITDVVITKKQFNYICIPEEFNANNIIQHFEMQNNLLQQAQKNHKNPKNLNLIHQTKS